MKLYQHIDELPIYNFDRFLANQDDNWLVQGYNGRQTRVEVPKSLPTEIMEQYYKEVDDRQFQVKIQKWAKIDNLITKYNVVSKILELISNGFPPTKLGMELRHNLIVELKNWRYTMPLINSVVGDLEHVNRIFTDLQGIKNQIAILKNELKDDARSENVSLYKQLAIIQMGLQLSHRIDPKVTTVAEWIEYRKLLQEKSKKN